MSKVRALASIAALGVLLLTGIGAVVSGSSNQSHGEHSGFAASASITANSAQSSGIGWD